MIINSAPQDQAILSNVGEIGEFRIRNSAKAFNILSSGLYANKVRAIIRELSCNAVDSHVAAGKTETPFDVHLPNQLEPWFSIRDYGTGLSHEQVTNIYTTYFESTKTNSNDFIGALGLGSKSPFSYTDNFTVTAIKDGTKGIYSAFINDSGVPSIAKMGEETTEEPAGVEIKFSVSDRYDFSKFQDEARVVYTYF
jgi:HSP90 family molecular chaperone